jgi:poly(hydroxyalkanoate) granule-associated protein
MATKKTKKKTKKSAKKSPAKKKTAKKKEEKWTWFDMLRTPILASVGAFSIAEEGIENFVRDLVERGETSEKEGRKIVEDFRKRTRKNRKELENKVDERIEKALKSFRLPTRKDIDTLARKIDKLENRVNALSRKKGK